MEESNYDSPKGKAQNRDSPPEITGTKETQFRIRLECAVLSTGLRSTRS
jgi:hypothetical protein